MTSNMRPLNKMSDRELAAEHARAQELSQDAESKDYYRYARRCVDCEVEIDRRRKGKEWAANYFGSEPENARKYRLKNTGRPPKPPEIETE